MWCSLKGNRIFSAACCLHLPTFSDAAQVFTNLLLVLVICSIASHNIFLQVPTVYIYASPNVNLVVEHDKAPDFSSTAPFILNYAHECTPCTEIRFLHIPDFPHTHTMHTSQNIFCCFQRYYLPAPSTKSLDFPVQHFQHRVFFLSTPPREVRYSSLYQCSQTALYWTIKLQSLTASTTTVFGLLPLRTGTYCCCLSHMFCIKCILGLHTSKSKILEHSRRALFFVSSLAHY